MKSLEFLKLVTWVKWVERAERYKLLFIRKINFPSSFLAAAAPNSLDFLLTISQFCGTFFTASLEHYSKKGR